MKAVSVGTGTDGLITNKLSNTDLYLLQVCASSP